MIGPYPASEHSSFLTTTSSFIFFPLSSWEDLSHKEATLLPSDSNFKFTAIFKGDQQLIP